MVSITKEHLSLVRKAGACQEGVRYKVGTPISEVAAEHLAWCEDKFPEESKSIATEVCRKAGVRGVCSLALIGYGYGDGSGDGYGYGYGEN